MTTSASPKRFINIDLGDNGNWVDLAIELKSRGLINKLGERAVENSG